MTVIQGPLTVLMVSMVRTSLSLWFSKDSRKILGTVSCRGLILEVPAFPLIRRMRVSAPVIKIQILIFHLRNFLYYHWALAVMITRIVLIFKVKIREMVRRVNFMQFPAPNRTPIRKIPQKRCLILQTL